MLDKKIIESLKSNTEKALEQLQTELSYIRAGAASVQMLASVYVESYGSSVALNQVGAVSVADARTLVITPFDKSDKSALKNIEKGILAANLDLNPQNDGMVVRINVPSPTEEKRKELVKKSKEIGEKIKIKIRSLRQDANESLKKGKKEGFLSDDDIKNTEKDVQKIVDLMIKKIEDQLKNKEKELMTI